MPNTHPVNNLLTPSEAHETTNDENITINKIDETDANHKENLIVENANIDAWKGDTRYFQTGAKAGKLKPSADAGGMDAEKANANPLEFSGLKTDDLKATAGKAKVKAAAVEEVKKRETKAEKRAVEGKIAASLVMRSLDLITDWISGGAYGKDFTPDTQSARMDYRAQLQSEWEAYLSTLDIPMHPALVVCVGSVMYIAPAIHTPEGGRKIDKVKAWVYSRWANRGSK
jgi:hypothetical protein